MDVLSILRYNIFSNVVIRRIEIGVLAAEVVSEWIWSFVYIEGETIVKKK